MEADSPLFALSDIATRLGSRDAAERRSALWAAADAVANLRGPYGAVVQMTGRCLSDRDPEVRAVAACVVEGWYCAATPIADVLAEHVAAADVDPWNSEDCPGRTERIRMVTALARLGDARAAPSLVAGLKQPRVPIAVPLLVQHLPAHREVFVHLLGERLARCCADPGSDYASALLAIVGLRHAGGTEALPQVRCLLRAAGPAGMLTLVGESLRALACFGAAEPGIVRPYLDSPDTMTAAYAALALSAAQDQAPAVLRTVLRHLDYHHLSPAAAEATYATVTRLGPLGAPAADRLRTLSDCAHRDRLDAATALWHVTGDHQVSLPTLLDAWAQDRFSRRKAATGLLAHGPVIGAPAIPLIKAETTAPHRHNRGASVRTAIWADEELLATCHAFLRHTPPTTTAAQPAANVDPPGDEHDAEVAAEPRPGLE